MKNFARFSEVRKKRSQMEGLAVEGMEDVKAGAIQIVCAGRTEICPYIRTCPNRNYCNPVSLYGIPADEV